MPRTGRCASATKGLITLLVILGKRRPLAARTFLGAHLLACKRQSGLGPIAPSQSPRFIFKPDQSRTPGDDDDGQSAHSVKANGWTVACKVPAISEVPNVSQSVVKIDPEIMSGAPCFAGTRVPIQNLIDYLEGGDSIEDFLEGFPSVSREQVIAFLEEAKDRMLDAASK